MVGNAIDLADLVIVSAVFLPRTINIKTRMKALNCEHRLADFETCCDCRNYVKINLYISFIKSKIL